MSKRRDEDDEQATRRTIRPAGQRPNSRAIDTRQKATWRRLPGRPLNRVYTWVRILSRKVGELRVPSPSPRPSSSAG